MNSSGVIPCGAFVRAWPALKRQHLLDLSYPAALPARFAALAEAPVQAQQRIGTADIEPFEDFRQACVSAERLNVRQGESAASAAAAASAVTA